MNMPPATHLSYLLYVDDHQGWQGRWGALTSAPRPAPPSAPGLARASRSPDHPPDLFCPGLNRGQGWHVRESRSCTARRALAVSRASLCAYAGRATAHTHVRRHAMLHATTSGGIMNDAVLVCICKVSARAHTLAALA